MPVTTQSVNTSGISEIAGQPLVYVTYQAPILGGQYGQYDVVPGFLYITGRVRYRQDSDGNAIAENF